MSPQMARIVARVKRHPTILDLDQDRLGEDLLEIAADGIEAQCAQQIDPDDNPWPELNAAYAAWKVWHHAGKPMGELYGFMLLRSQIEGEQWVGPREARMVYGTADETKQEATYFSEGTIDGAQPPRRFYGLNALSRQYSHQRIAQQFRDGI